MAVAAADWRLAARSQRSLREGWLLAFSDFVVIAGCAALLPAALWLQQGPGGFAVVPGSALADWWILAEEPLVISVALTLACLALFRRFGHYARRRPFWDELGDVLGVAFMMALIHGALVSRMELSYAPLWLISHWALVALLVPVSRALLRHALIANGAWRRPTVVVGVGPNARETAQALADEPLLGLDVVAFLTPPQPGASGDDTPGVLEIDGHGLVPVLRPGPGPHLVPLEFGQPHVVVALETSEADVATDLVERLSLDYGAIDIVSPMRGLPLAGTQVTHFFRHDVLALRLQLKLARPLPKLIKRGFDLAGSVALLVALAPVFAFIAWRIRQSGGPVFYGHRRVGRKGEPFTCYKFRTMVPDADAVLDRLLAEDEAARAEWQRDHKLRNDPRVTRIGAWLRRTSLDELPQLWNVLRGEMSLVGPRPVVEAELPRYGKDVVYYMESKPGMTGLWQISGRNDLDYRRRVHLDCWYVKNWTLWYDLVILAQTARIVLLRQGAY